MIQAIMALLFIITILLWITWVAGVINGKRVDILKPIIYAICVMTPVTMAYGTYYGAYFKF